MSARAMVWDSVEGSSVVDLLSDGACSYGNQNVITNSDKARIVGTLNSITNSDFGTVVGDQNTILNSPDCAIFGGKNYTINTSTYKTTAIPNDYVVTTGCIRSDASALGGTPVYQQIPTVTSIPTSDNDVNTRPIPGGSLTFCSADNKFYTKGTASTWHDVKTSFNPQTLAQTLAANNNTGLNDIVVATSRSVQFTGSGTGVTVLNTAQTGATSRIVSFPNLAGNGAVVVDNATQTLTGKTLTSPTISGTPVISGGSINSTTIGNSTASTGRFTTVTTTATTNQLVLGTTKTVTITSPAPAASRTHTIPIATVNDSFVLNATAATLTNKTLSDTTTSVINAADATKVFRLDLGPMLTGTTITAQVLQGTSGTLVLANGGQTITDKNLTASSNQIYAERLWAAGKTASIAVSAAAVPLLGQSLTCTVSGTTAAWQYPQIPILAVGTSSETAIAVTAGVDVAITGDTFTCVTTGTYHLTYTSYYASSAPGAVTQFYFAINGAQVLNSVRKIESDGVNKWEPVCSNALVALTAGQVVTFRMTCDTTSTNTIGFRTMIGQYISV